MRKLWSLILVILPVVLVTSCHDDFDLNASYQDITIVYGLMDQGKDTTFLKINKAFLGEGNVLEMAKVEDSSIYKTDLAAVIEEYNGDNLVHSFFLDTIAIDNKEDGVFYNPYQQLYFAVIPVNEEHEYKLSIQVGSKEVTSSTPVVQRFSLTKPSAGSQYINIRYDTNPTVEWNSAENGIRYEIVIRFNFKELMLNDPDTISRFQDWALGTKKSKSTAGGEEMSVKYSGNAFYNWLETSVPYDDPAKESQVSERFTENLEYFIMVAAKDLNTYMEVNEPSNSIVQEKPQYTNVENGLGLFSSRHLESRAKRIHPETVARIKALDDPDLKFVY